MTAAQIVSSVVGTLFWSGLMLLIGRAWGASQEGERLRKLLDDARIKMDEQMRSTAKLRFIVSCVWEWTTVFGASLKPTGADTYGEGVRRSKAEVAAIILKAEPMEFD